MTLAAPAQRVWEAALGRLQVQVPRPTYDTWLRGTEGQSLADDRLVVSAPSPFVAEWLQGRMLGLIRDAVSAVIGRATEVALAVPEPSTGIRAPAPIIPEPEARTHADVGSGPMPTVSSDARLHPRYTFSSFVVGRSNRLAYAAASAVADAPGHSYNPLFIHGAVGLGKTHLLHAIGHQVQAAGRSVRYVTCEQFTNEFTAAIRERRMAEFQARYRSVDVLLVDDVQFLCGKDGTQEAFFHTFNVLHGADHQVVVAADRPAAALNPLDERLRSRLEWGLAADIAAPDLETRVAILEQRAQLAPVDVPADVIAFLATADCAGVRQLEGVLNRVTALAHFLGEPVTLDLAQRTVTQAQQDAQVQSPGAVIARVAQFYSLPPDAIIGPARSRPISHARQVAMLVLRQQGLRPEQIGSQFGGRDRTTVNYALERISSRAAEDSQLQAAITQLASPAQ